jgi:rhamnulose-1-phosphate aldolase
MTTVAQALTQMGLAGLRLDSMHATESAAGNISFALKDAPDLVEVFPTAEQSTLPAPAPSLVGWTVLVTGSGRRLRDIASDPGAAVAALTVNPDGVTATLRSAPTRAWAKPTSEFNSHLAVHADQVARRPELTQHAVVHAQPPYLVALSHVDEYRDSATFTRRIVRWEPETIVQLPDGVGVLDYMVPGSQTLMDASVAALRDHRLIVWSRHGILGRSDLGPLNVVDLVEYAETGALYDHLNTVAGNRSNGMSDAEIKAVVDAFDVPTNLF